MPSFSLKQLKVRQKLLLLGAAVMIPFAIITFTLVNSIAKIKLETTERERIGLQYHAPLLTMLGALQNYRAAVYARSNSVGTLGDRESQAAAALVQAIAEAEQTDARLRLSLGLGNGWAQLSVQLRRLLNDAVTLDADSLRERFGEIDTAVLALMAQVSDQSRLTVDPELASRYLMRVVIVQGPDLTVLVGRARAVLLDPAAGTADRVTTLISGQSARLAATLEQARVHQPSLTSSLGSAATQATAAIDATLAQLVGGAPGEVTDAPGAALQLPATNPLDALLALQRTASEELDRILQERQRQAWIELAQTLAWALAGLLFMLVIGWLVARDITGALSGVVATARSIATGDLSGLALIDRRKDEIGDLARAFDEMVLALKDTVLLAENIADGDLTESFHRRSKDDDMGNALAHMVERLSALVGDVHQSGIQVNTAVTQIAATTRHQQATATEIAATTTEIGATSKEISATSKELVKTMGEVSTVAEQSAARAASGQNSLANMEESMRHVMDAAASINSKLGVLNEKAGNINQVVTTITKVADQTNMLSLNAAIEAEKAGEYGRGFSVVAVEIRRLADQTAVATYDIELMVKDIQSAVSAGVMGMDKFTEEVRRGIHEVQDVGVHLSEIIQQVQTLAPRFEAVNEGMQAQASGAEQITHSLMQLGDAAQQTVDSLRQSGDAINGLHEAVASLRGGVARFKLAV